MAPQRRNRSRCHQHWLSWSNRRGWKQQQQLQPFLNDRNLCLALMLPRQTYTHQCCSSLPLGLRRLKEHIISVPYSKHWHFIFIKSYQLLLQKDRQKQTSASLKESERKQTASSQGKPPALLLTFSSTSVASPPHPLSCPKLCEFILHRKDVTCEAQEYYNFIFIK